MILKCYKFLRIQYVIIVQYALKLQSITVQLSDKVNFGKSHLLSFSCASQTGKSCGTGNLEGAAAFFNTPEMMELS